MNRNMIITRGVLLFLLVQVTPFFGPVSAQDPLPHYVMSRIVVSANRFPVDRRDLARSITVIGRDQIARSPASSVAELLEYVVGLDVRQRGPHGVQADLHMRGGSFEQVLVVLDGVKVSDPQTGHHDLNLPVALADIERIEVLRGPGVVRFGADAVDGVIHIITRRDQGGAPDLHFEAGQHGLRQMGMSWRWNGRTPANGFRLSINDGSSEGWRHNTDHRIRTLNGAAHLTFGETRIDLFQGWLDKRFGANQFYSSAFPDQWEHVRTALTSVVINRTTGWTDISGRLWWRRGRDEFLLDRSDPGFYRNRHRSDTAGLEVDLRWSGQSSQTAVGVESGLDRIRSSNLGDHDRSRFGVFVEHRSDVGERFDLGIGIFAGRLPGRGWEFWPSGSLALHIDPNLLFFGSVGRSLRIPSFTDLYYNDPVNQGNPGLEPERAWTIESGVRLSQSDLVLELILFQRFGRNVIDWVRDGSTDPWHARNIADITTRGVETAVTWSPADESMSASIQRVHLGYIRLLLDHTTAGFTSRYVFDHLAHQAVLDLTHRLPLGVGMDWRIRYEVRTGEPGRTITDLMITRRFKRIGIFIAATNLFGAHYRDLGVVPLPGRWIRTGIRFGGSGR